MKKGIESYKLSLLRIFTVMKNQQNQQVITILNIKFSYYKNNNKLE